MKSPFVVVALLATLIWLNESAYGQTADTGSKEVPLLSQVDAPIIADGKQIGSVKLPVGSLVSVVAVQADGIMVKRGEGVPFKVSKDVIAPDALAVALATPTPRPVVIIPQATPTPTPTPTPVVVAAPVFFDKLKPLLSAPYSGKSPHYTAIYYSAHWCGPCRAFTPKLVAWYKSFKPDHPDFDLIFSSCDKDDAAMQEYIKLMSMPWPTFAFAKKDTRLLSAFFPKGIPCLVFLDEHGKQVVPDVQNRPVTLQDVLHTIETTVH